MRQIVLLRAVNLGSRNRVAMPALREALTGAGPTNVRTYLQSGNVVLDSDAKPEQLGRVCERAIAERFELELEVLVRTRAELAAIVRRDPLRGVAENPKRYQVTFLSADPHEEAVRKLSELAAPAERLVAIGRELYVWHPDGVARSRLSARLARPGLGFTATARNWTTVETLLAMADE